MRMTSCSPVLAALCAGGSVFFALPDIASAQGCSTVRASVATDGSQGTGSVGQIDLSANGRYVVFTTSSPNIVPGSLGQIIRRDLLSGTTTLVSAGPGGVPASTGCEVPSASADGRWVAFATDANNLGPVDTNTLRDVYLHDCETGDNFIASGNPGLGPLNGMSTNPDVSDDGRYVAFQSAFTNLDPADTNGFTDIYVYDRLAGTTELVSITANGVQGDSGSTRPSISGDGRYVAFSTGATTFHPADVNGLNDIFVKDRLTGALTLVSARPEGMPGNGFSDRPSISADGRFVAFESRSTDLGPPHHPMYAGFDVYVRDLLTSTTTAVDRTIFGAPPMYDCLNARLSADGRFVAFDSQNLNLVIGDTNNSNDVFLHDRRTGQTRRVNLSNADQQSTNYSGVPAISADGTRVAFISWSADLVPDDTNDRIDVYVRTCPLPVGMAFCSGDGSATTCPCGNAGAIGTGCAHPVQPAGARLFALGVASATNDSLVLRGEGLTNSIATYFQGTSMVNGGQGIVFGDGLVCAAGGLVRLGQKLGIGGVSGYPAAGDLPVSVRGNIPAGGGVTRTYQVWFRSSAPFCTPDTFNYTNGVQIPWQP
ncbi:MAG: PD40 domain-containing protein [Planctomycetes bacterium]|nr:PD40 domain-containing protein [Planctomycetota bacterium]